MRATFLLLFLLTFTANAANRYLKVGAAGSNNGTDWSNAYNEANQVTLAAGDTLWVSGGTYTTALTLAVNGSSGSPILIKRVTVNDATPVAATGWSSAFDSLVTLSGVVIDTAGDYVTLDGRTNYGILVTNTASSIGIKLNRGNVTVTNCWLRGPQNDAMNVTDAGGCPLYGPTGTTSNNVSHCRISHSSTLVQHYSDNFTIEYTEMDHSGCGNSGTFHPNVCYLNGNTNQVFRYNYVHDYSVEGFFEGNGGATIYFYGNVLWSTLDTSRGLELPNGQTTAALYVYNNTFVDFPNGALSIQASPTTGAVTNNIAYNCTLGFGTMAHNYNLLSASNSEANGIGSATSAIFVNYAGQDFHIVSTVGAAYPKDKGATIANANGQVYNADKDGDTRGNDGTWDIGAYEYTTSAVTGPRATINRGVLGTTNIQ